MAKSNTKLYDFARSHLGEGGARFRRYCGLPSGAAWCAAFVTYIFHESDYDSLFFNGRKVVYVPTAEAWCFANLANIPPYLAMAGDIVTFDWNNNGTPDHIGFARERKSDTELKTIEGNTSGGIVADKTRNAKYISGVFRPHFTHAWKDGPLEIDGKFEYSSIAMLRKALGLEPKSVLSKTVVKTLQKRVGVAPDGSWGKKTSKAVQKMVGVEADGYWGIESTKALQKWINKQNGYTPSKKTIVDDLIDACKVQAEWSKNAEYAWENHPTKAKTKHKQTCVSYDAVTKQRIGVLKSGEAIWHNHGKVDGANDKMKVTYLSGTLKSNKSKLKRGDTVIIGDKNSMEAGGNSHICTLTGKWDENGNPYVYDNNSAVRVRKGKKPQHTWDGNWKMIARIRLKEG